VIPSLVAFEFYKSCTDRSQMEQARRQLTNTLDRIIDFTDETALEAADLDERLKSEEITLSPVDLLDLADVDIVHTS